MQPKRLLTPFLVCSSIILGGASSCHGGPKVTVYVSTPASNGMNYSNEATGAKGLLPYSQSDKFVCFNPADAETLINYCNASSAQSASAQ